MNDLARRIAIEIQLAAPYDPGAGAAPPGSDKITTIINWGAWIVCAVAVLGIMIIGAKLIYDNHRGMGGSDTQRSLAYGLGGCAVIGMAAGLVGALVP